MAYGQLADGSFSEHHLRPIRCLPPYKEDANLTKSNMVINGNIKVKESAIEVYGKMQVIKGP